jgi:hypothetical protein
LWPNSDGGSGFSVAFEVIDEVPVGFHGGNSQVHVELS